MTLWHFRRKSRHLLFYSSATDLSYNVPCGLLYKGVPPADCTPLHSQPIPSMKPAKLGQSSRKALGSQKLTRPNALP